MNKNDFTWLILSIFAFISIPACSGGGGGGGSGSGGPSFANATPVTLTQVNEGDLIAGGVDTFKFTAMAGKVYCIEIFAIRFDQEGWDGGNDGSFESNLPRMRLFDTNGSTVILEHDIDTWIFDWGVHDLDFPMFRAPADGEYFISLENFDNSRAGGVYALIITDKTPVIPNLQDEAESTTGVQGDNDSIPGAEMITPDTTVHGNYVDNESDFYSFTITGPTIVSFEVTSYRNGVFRGDNEFFDPNLVLYDSSGTPLTSPFDIDIDDYYAYDPALCFKLNPAAPPETYTIEVTESLGAGDADYFLKYTAKTGPIISEGEGDGSDGNSSFANAKMINFGDIIAGDVAPGGGDDADWFLFNGQAGDIIHIRQFDLNSCEDVNSNDEINVTLLGPGQTIIGYTGPPSPTGPGLRTTSAILQENGTYSITIDSRNMLTTGYSFDLEYFRQASPTTHEVNTPGNNNDLITEPDFLDGNGFAAGVITENTLDEDYFEFAATDGDIVTINIYAAPQITPFLDSVVPDLNGNGSTLEPVIEVFSLVEDPVDPIFISSYTPPTEGSAIPLSASSLLPTLTLTYTVVFTDPNTKIRIYSESPSAFQDEYYLIEVIIR